MPGNGSNRITLNYSYNFEPFVEALKSGCGIESHAVINEQLWSLATIGVRCATHRLPHAAHRRPAPPAAPLQVRRRRSVPHLPLLPQPAVHPCRQLAPAMAGSERRHPARLLRPVGRPHPRSRLHPHRLALSPMAARPVRPLPALVHGPG